MKSKMPLPAALKLRIRELRRDATDAEQLLWSLLRGRSFSGAKFRRQHPLGGFILDFYCDEAKLAVELDGSQHQEAEQARMDEERSRILAGQYGVRVIRFWNSEVLSQTERVLGAIQNALDEQHSHIRHTPFSSRDKARG